MNDKSTLESQKKLLEQDRESIQQGVEQNRKMLEQVGRELEQRVGALNFIAYHMKRIDEALAALDAAGAGSTPPAS